jgi:hypothetical protein
VEDAQSGRLWIVPLTPSLANASVEVQYGHHGRVAGHRFSLGVMDEAGMLRAVAIAGTPNAASALYGGARRVARAMGFRRIVTYTLADEPGTSLRGRRCRFFSCRIGQGRCVGEAGGGSDEARAIRLSAVVAAAFLPAMGRSGGRTGDTPSRRREDDHPTGPKVRWQVEFACAWPGGRGGPAGDGGHHQPVRFRARPADCA